MKIKSETGVHATFKVSVIRKGEEVVLAPEQPNLLLNQYFATDAKGKDTHLHVGTGVTPPEATDVALASPLEKTATEDAALTESGSVELSPLSYESWRTRGFKFAVGAVVGNISELGIGTSSGSLLTRALIKDLNGDPTTITIEPTDELHVAYTFYSRRTLGAPVSGSVDTVDGPVGFTLTETLSTDGIQHVCPIPYTPPAAVSQGDLIYVLAAVAQSTATVTIDPVTRGVTGAFGALQNVGGSKTSAAVSSPVPGTLRRKIEFSATTAQANQTDIKFLLFGWHYSSVSASRTTLVIEFDTPWDKLNTEVLSFNIEVDYVRTAIT